MLHTINFFMQLSPFLKYVSNGITQELKNFLVDFVCISKQYALFNEPQPYFCEFFVKTL